MTHERSKRGGLSRRGFVGLGLAGLAAACAIDGFIVEPQWVEVTRHEVPVRGLPDRLDGYRIAQLTDLHLRSLGPLHDAVVDALAEADPQLVVLTGDIVDSPGGLPLIDAFLGRLGGLSGRLVATLGNWEHWGAVPIDRLARIYWRHRVPLLVDEVEAIDGLAVAGTDDGATGRADLSRTFGELRGGSDAQILLTHAPGILDEAGRSPQFALTLCGHTHGGQVRLGPYAPVVPPGSGRFICGRYDTRFGPAYVSRGIGTSTIPVRFMCRPELPIFTLRQA